MAEVTFVTACAPYHAAHVERAAASVAAQTSPSLHIIVKDEQQRGAGWARNQGLAQVATRFVVFLDADDWIEPSFVERCLSAFDGRHYVYTDHWQGDKRVDAPRCAWVNKTWHPITALVPTVWALKVGGFDEALAGAEDTEFYLKLVTSGYCGKRLAEPLFHYGADGQRSKLFMQSAAYTQTMKLFTEKYGGKPMACGDCGDSPNIDMPPAGEKQLNDVLAMAVWNGNRVERGRSTGRLYPRTGNGKQLWVDPRDAAASPNLFRVVEAVEMPPPPEPVLDDLGAIMRVMTPVMDAPSGDYARFIPSKVDTRPVEPVQAAPDVRKAVGLYQAVGNG